MKFVIATLMGTACALVFSPTVWAGEGKVWELEPGEKLTAGQSRTSSDARVKLTLEKNGNLVLKYQDLLLWEVNHGQALRSPECVMQSDGNLVIYEVSGTERKAAWASHTDKNPGAVLRVQTDGNLVVYHENKPIWATDTMRRVEFRTELTWTLATDYIITLDRLAAEQLKEALNSADVTSVGGAIATLAGGANPIAGFAAAIGTVNVNSFKRTLNRDGMIGPNGVTITLSGSSFGPVATLSNLLLNPWSWEVEPRK